MTANPCPSCPLRHSCEIECESFTRYLDAGNEHRREYVRKRTAAKVARQVGKLRDMILEWDEMREDERPEAMDRIEAYLRVAVTLRPIKARKRQKAKGRKRRNRFTGKKRFVNPWTRNAKKKTGVMITKMETRV